MTNNKPILDKIIKYKENNSNFAYYFTGLLEGDGTIITPKTERSSKDKLNYPSIQITFNLKDLPLALVVQKELTFGSLSRLKGTKAYRLTINNIQGILLIINILNGKMRTPKIIDLWKLIDWVNQKYSELNLLRLPINDSNIESNAWLSGFIDADGHFAIRTTKGSKYIKVECKLVIVQSRVDHNNNDKKDVLIKIAKLLSTTVKSTRNDKPKSEYSLRTTNLKGNLEIKNYLNNYQLFSSKYLDYKDWLKVLIFFEKGKVKHKNSIESALYIKKGINNNRTVFNWDHLQNFYSLG
jgi:hypothetical protein